LNGSLTIEALAEKGFDVMYLSHARAILAGDFEAALTELATVLDAVSLPITEIIGSGGGETRFTQRLRRSLAALGWQKHKFVISKVVDGTPRESTSHEIDHVKAFDNGVIACEIEWNNKDPFFDRDLENFKRLHAEGAISAGVLITRGHSLQESLRGAVERFATERDIKDMASLERHGVRPTPKQRVNILKRVERQDSPLPFAQAWTENFVANKFGQATTHWAKLIDRVERGVGNPCPLLLLGLPASILGFDAGAVEPVGDEDLRETD
jgi:Restriction endonuclease BglII